MTEAEWLACEDVEKLVQFVGEQVGARKLRLFACACCRKLHHTLKDRFSLHAVQVAEAHADGLVSESEAQSTLHAVDQALDKAMGAEAQGAVRAAITLLRPSAADAVSCAWRVARAESAWRLAGKIRGRRAAEARVYKQEQKRQSGLLRDIVASPFRPVTFSPEWRTGTAAALARQMYEAREFSAMPILADALQDAGCDSAAVLDHCRGPGPHVRGCWVVDLVLGKE